MELAERNQPWWQLLSIQAACYISLPNILVGHLIGHKFGLGPAFLAICIGNILLLALGYSFAVMSTRSPKSTVEYASIFFGESGGSVIASLMIALMLCWFGIQLNVMSVSLHQLMSIMGLSFPHFIYHFTISFALSGLMCLGIRAIKLLSYLSAPLLILLCLGLSKTEPTSHINPISISWLGGISTIIGMNIVGVIDLPTFFRHARSEKDSIVSIFALYGLVMPLIQTIGVYLSTISNGDSILTDLYSGHGLGWTICVSCFVVISGWLTNNGNLYSAVISSHSLRLKVSPIARTFILGALGACIGCVNPLKYFEHVLNLMAGIIVAMGAVILANSILGHIRKYHHTTFLSWVVGISFCIYLSYSQSTITGVLILDAFLASFVTQLTINFYLKSKRIKTA